ncbi:MAG TPA: class I SAM-dependent methyltransferase [Ktedonobacteraceae bacterium]|jgi:SAM-dependent methyltransferase|nr:class I SAM-dependent methyltransferase [Ktedonobacteraceae bacterium]
MHIQTTEPLHLDAATFRTLLQLQGPSLGLWRAAEVAALREQVFEPPVLDLGCGDGLVTSMVLSKVEIGLDPDEKVLERAAQRHVYERFEAVPAEEMRLPDASIGTVLSNSVLEHLPCLDAVLAEVARVLRPGGHLIFTCPTEAFSRWLVLPSARYAAWRNRQLRHLNLWPTERWIEHLNNAGLEVELVRPYLRHGWVSLWDALELAQQVWIADKRLVGMIWRRIPSSSMDRLARKASQLNLAASVPGGGRLIVARKC